MIAVVAVAYNRTAPRSPLIYNVYIYYSTLCLFGCLGRMFRKWNGIGHDLGYFQRTSSLSSKKVGGTEKLTSEDDSLRDV